MATTFLLLGAVCAALTAVSHRPLYRPGTAALVGWFPAWLFSELPVHLLLLELGLAAGFVAAGALGHWHGWVGLALMALAIAGAVRHVALANATTETFERGLAETLGNDYHTTIDDDLRRRYDPTTSLRSLAAVFPFRPFVIERIRNLPYAKVGRRTLSLDVLRALGATAADAADPGVATTPAGSPQTARPPVITHRERLARPGTPRPVFLYVHGGGWVIGHKGQQGRVLLHELAAAGWICVAINYRLSPRATWPEHILDVKQAIRWVREHIAEYGGDPDFVIIGGGSAGAHLASLAALTPGVGEWQREFPEVDTAVQGCVAFYGVYDFTDEARHFRHRAFRNLLLERVVMKRRFDDAREEYVKASPLGRLGAERGPDLALPPFLVIHGDTDSLAPVGGARRFRDALRGARGECAYVELPGANHAFELFPSLRSVPVAHGVHRYCQVLYSRYLRQRAAQNASQPAAAIAVGE